MKVLLINGSPNKNGCTFTALNEVKTALERNGIAAEIFHIGAVATLDCTSCRKCRDLGKCVFDNDCVNVILEKAKECDGFIFGSPVYYAHASGRLLSVLDRVFYSGSKYFAHKPGAAVTSARRAGTTSSLDDINKYFTIAQMPVVSSTYWNMVFGNTPDEVRQDKEGMQSMRNLGENMAWLLKCIEAGKKANVPEPNIETQGRTNFVR